MIGALALVARLFLAAVFALAGTAKLADPPGTRAAVVAFGGPRRLAPAIALGVPMVELLVAALLVIPATAPAGAAAALVLLVFFTAIVARTLVRGEAVDCRCFGQLHSAPTSWRTLGRNAGLGTIAILALAGSLVAEPRSVVGWTGDLGGAELLALAVAGTATAVVAVGAVAFVTLLRSYGHVLVRLERVEAALTEAGIELASDDAPRLGLAPGTAAPWFLASTPAGHGRSRDDLLEPGLPVLLLFTSPNCAPCTDLLPEAAKWQREHAERLSVVFAAAGPMDAVRAEAAGLGLADVLVDEDGEIAKAFGAQGTPSAVLVAPDGTVSTWVAGGRDEIEALLARALSHGHGETGLPLGAEVPPLELPSLEGETVALGSLRGRDTVLLFWNPGCGFCRSMHDDLVAWEQSANGVTPRLVVVSSGGEGETRAEGFRSLVLLDAEYAAGEAFGARGTPMAVLVDSEGRVASPVVSGADEVFALANRHLSLADR